ncbi:MAG TPA: hypothetical protein VI197_07030, partial [Polyangiaceae bacterium]
VVAPIAVPPPVVVPPIPVPKPPVDELTLVDAPTAPESDVSGVELPQPVIPSDTSTSSMGSHFGYM